MPTTPNSLAEEVTMTDEQLDALFALSKQHALKEVFRRKARALLSASKPAASEGWRKGQWDYQTIFNAIADAVTVNAAASASISVQAFEDAMLAASPATPAADARGRQPMVQAPMDFIEARAQGRAEALALLLRVDTDTFCSEYIVDGGSLPSGERDEGWDKDKLRELFSADDSAYSLMQSAEAEYWHHVGLRDDAEIVLKQLREQRATCPAAPAQSGEPVAWLFDGGRGERTQIGNLHFDGPNAAQLEIADKHGWKWTPLYAAPQPAQTAQSGQWVHCSPALLKAGVSCANTPRRACACEPENGGHDHFIAHESAPSSSAVVLDDERAEIDCGCSNSMLYCSEAPGCQLGLDKSRAASPQPVAQTDRALTDDDTQAAGLIAQHHRDSAELRKLCDARDQARRTAEYWKAEHLAGNDQIARLTREMGAFRLLVAACNRLWAEAEEIETADGLAQVALQQYWEAFIEARDNACSVLTATQPPSGVDHD